MPARQNGAIAKPKSQHRARALRIFFSAMVALALAVLWATSVRAEQKIIKSHGISTFGELKYPADFPYFDYVNPDAPKGGEFSTWGFGTFDSLTPFILKGNAAQLSTVFFDTLMTGNLDEPDAMYGLAAESIEYPEDRSWVIFHMRPEAKFADGSAMRAEDVVFSFEILRDKGAPTYKVLFKDFAKVEALDDLTVKFTFVADAIKRELPMTAAGIPIFSKAYYATRDFAESTLEPPLGSGAYELLSVDAGRSVAYQRRDDYWARDLPVNVGQNNFDVIKIEYFADYTAAFEAFKGGAYGFREEYLSKLWATSYDFPAIEKGWVIKEELPDGNPAGTQGFWFNLRRPQLQDPLVRQARPFRWRSILNGRTKACFTAFTSAPTVSGKTRKCRPKGCLRPRNWPCWNPCAPISPKAFSPNSPLCRQSLRLTRSATGNCCAAPASCWIRRGGPWGMTVCDIMTRGKS